MSIRRDWLKLSDWLKRYFPEDRLQKVTLDAGFTCPTRDGTISRGGCTYCNNESFSPAHAIRKKSILEQLEEGKSFFKKKYPEMKFLAYFQAYTNTYGKVSEVIKLYEEAFRDPEIKGLVIGTRPDCMPLELLDYLEELHRERFVIVEYGVESTKEETLERIRRGHTFEVSSKMIEETAKRGIPVGAHLIMGLPGETRQDYFDHLDRLSKLPINLIKMHQLQIIKGTIMAREYQLHPERFHLFTPEEYVELCAEFVQHVPEDVVIERFVSQAPRGMVIAPQWGVPNYQLTEMIRKRLQTI